MPCDGVDPSGLDTVDDVLAYISAGAGVVATAADLTGVGFGIGTLAGAVAIGGSAGKAIYDCAGGAGRESCGGSVTSAAITTLSAGTAIAMPEGTGAQYAADFLGNYNDAVGFFGIYG